MSTAITSIHFIVAVILIISVLLQSGKGSGLGAAFGGSSSSVFGARGPATLISRVTTVAAVIFMVTSLTLSIFAQGGGPRGSVVTEDEPVPVEAASPAEGRSISEDELQQPAGSLAAPGAGEAEGQDESEGEAAQPASEDSAPAAAVDAGQASSSGEAAAPSSEAPAGASSEPSGEASSESSASDSGAGEPQAQDGAPASDDASSSDGASSASDGAAEAVSESSPPEGE